MACPSGYGGSSLPSSEWIRASTSVRHCDACVRVWAFLQLNNCFNTMKTFPLIAA